MKGIELGKFNDEQEEEAGSWGQKAEELIKNCPNTQFLSISATPQRDSDGIDPMEIFAVLTGDYSAEELRNKDYMASDMSLVEALENGLVVQPTVITFDCLLDQTREYTEMRRLLKVNQKKSKDITIKGGKATDQYNVLLVKFLEACKITGKLDFIREKLKENPKYDKSVLESLEIFLEEREDAFLDKNGKVDINKIFKYYTVMLKRYWSEWKLINNI